MLRVFVLALACALPFVQPAASAGSVLSEYRGVTLGDSVQTVVDRLHLAPADVKVVLDRPTLVQEVTWRPHRFISGTTVEPDPLTEMVLTFHQGRLARIGVIYDRDRTQGLTNADLQEVMGRVYGASMLMAAPTQPAMSPSAERRPIGQWADAETLLVLWRELYPSRVGLTITSLADDPALQDAIAAGARLQVSEGPKRDLARRNAEAAAVLARDEKTRRDNKATFKP